MELMWPKGASKRRASSSPTSVIYGDRSHKLSRGYEVASVTNIDRRLGGLKESMILVLQLLRAPGVKLPVVSHAALTKSMTEMSAWPKEAKTEAGITAENIPVSFLPRSNQCKFQSPYHWTVPTCMIELFYVALKEGCLNDLVTHGKGERGSESMPCTKEPVEKCTKADEKSSDKDEGKDNKIEEEPPVQENGGGG
jgi:hypothetical protein